jgi:hypothetical protein
MLKKFLIKFPILKIKVNDTGYERIILIRCREGIIQSSVS